MIRTIIEITYTNRHQKDCKIMDSSVISVGRSYKNDVIISDPYVSAEHILIRADNDGWVIEDLGSENGIFFEKDSKVLPAARITSGDKIIIGKTHIRIFSSLHPIRPAKVLPHTRKIFKKLRKPINALGLLGITFFAYFIEGYFNSYLNVTLHKLILDGIVMVVIAFAGAGVWGFIGHLIKNKSKFTAHLSFISLFFLLLLLVNNVCSYIGYFASSEIVELASGVILWSVLFFVLLMSNLYIATNISFNKRIIASGLISLLVTGIIVLGSFERKSYFKSNPEPYLALKPPFIKIFPSESIDKFIEESESVFYIIPVKHKK